MNWFISRIASNPWLLFWIAGCSFVAGGSVAWEVQSWRLDALQARFDLFVSQTEALEKAAQIKADETKKSDQLKKEQADRENIRIHAADAATIKRLRDQNSSRSILPPAPAGSSRPDLICLDRVEYLREDGNATEKLFSGARSLSDEGTANTIDLNTAKNWAQGK